MPPSPSKPGNSFRRFAETSGRRGEMWAALFLKAQLYRIVATRVKTPVGEIDLIAERFGVTVFVEVKSRSFSHQEGEALLARQLAAVRRLMAQLQDAGVLDPATAGAYRTAYKYHLSSAEREDDLDNIGELASIRMAAAAAAVRAAVATRSVA